MSKAIEPSEPALAASSSTFLCEGWRYSCVLARITFLSYWSQRLRDRRARDANRISALEGPVEHAPIGGEDAKVLVDERAQVVVGFILVHSRSPLCLGLMRLRWTRFVVAWKSEWRATAIWAPPKPLAPKLLPAPRECRHHDGSVSESRFLRLEREHFTSTNIKQSGVLHLISRRTRLIMA